MLWFNGTGSWRSGATDNTANRQKTSSLLQQQRAAISYWRRSVVYKSKTRGCSNVEKYASFTSENSPVPTLGRPLVATFLYGALELYNIQQHFKFESPTSILFGDSWWVPTLGVTLGGFKKYYWISRIGFPVHVHFSFSFRLANYVPGYFF